MENTPTSPQEGDVGDMPGDLWQEALENVCLNVSERLSQLYILLRAHHTPLKLCSMGLRPDPLFARRGRDMGDFIHLLWKCPKLHYYWNTVVAMVSAVFQVSFSVALQHCILAMLDAVTPDKFV